MRRNRSVAAAASAAMAVLVAGVSITLANPATGVTPLLLARGTYDSFKVASQQGPAMFKAESKGPIDVVVRRHEYIPGGSTGWHMHPYPVLVTVVSGEVTFYEYDDPTCTGTVVSAGEGYVDSGDGHIGINRAGEPAVDVSVILAPVGQPFRQELTAPGPFCDF